MFILFVNATVFNIKIEPDNPAGLQAYVTIMPGSINGEIRL